MPVAEKKSAEVAEGDATMCIYTNGLSTLVAELKKVPGAQVATSYNHHLCAKSAKVTVLFFLVTGEKLPHCAPKIQLGGIFTVFVNWQTCSGVGHYISQRKGDREKGPATKLNLGPYALHGISAMHTQTTELVYNDPLSPIAPYVLVMGMLLIVGSGLAHVRGHQVPQMLQYNINLNYIILNLTPTLIHAVHTMYNGFHHWFPSACPP